jgi:hypothetical protein
LRRVAQRARPAVRNAATDEEAGEHRMPRDAAKFMVQIIVPIADQTTSGTYLCHDGICGKGGPLTVDEVQAGVGRKDASRAAAELAGQFWPTTPVPGAAPMEPATVNVTMPPLAKVAVSAA